MTPGLMNNHLPDDAPLDSFLKGNDCEDTENAHFALMNCSNAAITEGINQCSFIQLDNFSLIDDDESNAKPELKLLSTLGSEDEESTEDDEYFDDIYGGNDTAYEEDEEYEEEDETYELENYKPDDYQEDEFEEDEHAGADGFYYYDGGDDEVHDNEAGEDKRCPPRRSSRRSSDTRRPHREGNHHVYRNAPMTPRPPSKSSRRDPRSPSTPSKSPEHGSRMMSSRHAAHPAPPAMSPRSPGLRSPGKLEDPGRVRHGHDRPQGRSPRMGGHVPPATPSRSSPDTRRGAVPRGSPTRMADKLPMESPLNSPAGGATRRKVPDRRQVAHAKSEDLTRMRRGLASSHSKPENHQQHQVDNRRRDGRPTLTPAKSERGLQRKASGPRMAAPQRIRRGMSSRNLIGGGDVGTPSPMRSPDNRGSRNMMGRQTSMRNLGDPSRQVRGAPTNPRSRSTGGGPSNGRRPFETTEEHSSNEFDHAGHSSPAKRESPRIDRRAMMRGQLSCRHLGGQEAAEEGRRRLPPRGGLTRGQSVRNF